jgi:hypothetical protein
LKEGRAPQAPSLLHAGSLNIFFSLFSALPLNIQNGIISKFLPKELEGTSQLQNGMPNF